MLTFNLDETCSIDSSFMWEMVSSTCLSHGLICSLKIGNIVLSNSTINIPTSTGPNSEPICLCIDIPIVTKMHIFGRD